MCRFPVGIGLIHLKHQLETWLLALLLAGLNCLALSAAGQSVYSEAYTFTTFAGIARTGSADGVGTDAQFDSPFGVAEDSVGNVYVADSDNNTIRKVTPAGVVTTLAGVAGYDGTNDGAGSAARFSYPIGLAVDNMGNVYVADSYNNTIRMVTQDGVVTTLAGNAAYYGTNDGTGSAAEFDYPKGVAVDIAGNVYVADSYNGTIRKLTPTGTNWVVTTLAGFPQFKPNGAPAGGTNDGIGSAARFNFPQGVAVDSSGNVYVGDSDNNTIRKVTPEGVVTTIAGSPGRAGNADGTGTKARFSLPFGLAIDSANNIYVADADNNTIRIVSPSGTNWVVTTLAGAAGIAGHTDGTGSNARFSFPTGVAVDIAGTICVADTDNSTVRTITSAGLVTTLAGVADSYGTLDGTGSEARFDIPWALATADNGDVYVADSGNCAIRKITSAGLVTTLAGFPGLFGSADGIGTEARFKFPEGVAVDIASNIYVADSYNNTMRKVSPDGVVTTLAGTAGTHGSADGIGARARFHFPFGVAVDNSSNVYVADTDNHTIRKLMPVPGTANWEVSTIAGLAGVHGSADGTNKAARFYDPAGLAIDSAGNLFVADTFNYTIREITPVARTTNWVVSTIAGSPGIVGSVDGIGTNALFGDGGYSYRVYGPYGVAVDSAENLYVADSENSTIRKITPVGGNWVVSTIAGLAGQYSFANGAGSAALFDFPDGVAVSRTGILYVADTDNNTVRKGVFSQYTPADVVPVVPPPDTASLVVTLLPPEANGQWRFPWELTWRKSGEAATNLVQGEYPIEFSTSPGYLILPVVAIGGGGTTVTNLVAVTNGGTTFVTNQILLLANHHGRYQQRRLADGKYRAKPAQRRRLAFSRRHQCLLPTRLQHQPACRNLSDRICPGWRICHAVFPLCPRLFSFSDDPHDNLSPRLPCAEWDSVAPAGSVQPNQGPGRLSLWIQRTVANGRGLRKRSGRGDKRSIDCRAFDLQRSDFILREPGLLVFPGGSGSVRAGAVAGAGMVCAQRLRCATNQRCPGRPWPRPIQPAVARPGRGRALFRIACGRRRLWWEPAIGRHAEFLG